jgi:hypothetical protein
VFALSNKLLIESYYKSIELNVDYDFIQILEREITRRIREGVIVENFIDHELMLSR